jgi:hypothetical protein
MGVILATTTSAGCSSKALLSRICVISASSLCGALAGSTGLFMSLVPAMSSTTLGRLRRSVPAA